MMKERRNLLKSLEDAHIKCVFIKNPGCLEVLSLRILYLVVLRNFDEHLLVNSGYSLLTLRILHLGVTIVSQ